MRIGFIGAGHVGYSMSKYLNDKYHNVIGIYSKDLEDAIECARFSISEYYKDLDDLISDCDTLFLTVNDDAIVKVVDELIKLNVCGKTLIHTSGSITSEVFGDLKNNNYCYSLHPIYAFNDKYNSYKELNNAYLTLEGPKDKEDLIKELFKDKILLININDKVKYHAGCVIVSNLVCGVLNTAEELFKSIGIDDLNAFKPLVLNNINNILEYGSLNALTGPIKRNDIGTVKKHLDALSIEEKKIYIPLSLKLCEMSGNHKEMIDLLKGELKND